MAFSISDFHASINRHGLAKNHSFRMRITPPPIIFGQVQNRFPVVNDSIHFYCRSVTLPELDITTADVQHQGFGAITRRPQTMNFPVPLNWPSREKSRDSSLEGRKLREEALKSRGWKAWR
jgi:hypothetical protein